MLKKYDFLCVRSYDDKSLPLSKLHDFLRYNPINPHAPSKSGKGSRSHRKITVDLKMGIVLVTYSGANRGPKEALTALALLESDLEHLRHICLGRFSYPGKMFNRPTPGWRHSEMHERHNERDLLRAELFIEEMLEYVHQRTGY